MAPAQKSLATLSRREYLKIAAEADVDWRVVQSYFAGTTTPRAATKRVIRMALAVLGLPDRVQG